MIVDSSALIAIVFDEPDAEAMLNALAEASSLKISAVTWVETHVVVANRTSVTTSRDRLQQNRLKEIFAVFDMQIIAVDQDLARDARDAHMIYGRGRHPARLNFGDCFSYALAKRDNEPLLFKGNDFSQTDLVPALTP